MSHAAKRASECGLSVTPHRFSFVKQLVLKLRVLVPATFAERKRMEESRGFSLVQLFRWPGNKITRMSLF